MSYHVVGCTDCSALWIIDNKSATSAVCTGCGRRHQRDKLRSLATASNREEAAQQRSALLISRRGEADADLDGYWLQERRAADPIVDDRQYLDGLGLDSDLVDDLTPDDTKTKIERSTSPTTEPGTGPDVDVEIADRPQLHGTPNSDAVAPGISVLDPGGQLGIAGHTYRDVSPRTSEWLGEVLQDLVPSTARLVQDLSQQHDEGVDPMDSDQTNYEVTRFITKFLVGEVAELDDMSGDAGAIEEARSYLDAIGRYALLWANDVYRVRRGFDGEEQFERVQQVLETTGTSRGQFNAGIEALRYSLCALHAERDSPLPLTFVLDGEAWTEADSETIKRCLAAFDVLADSFDVRVWMSPGVRQRVRRLVHNSLDVDEDSDVPTWAERFNCLTQGESTSRRLDDVKDAQTVQGWDAVSDSDLTDGRRRLLYNLQEDDARSVKVLKRDDSVDLGEGTVDRYCGDLESRGLVEVDRSAPSNELTLTPLGVDAMQYVGPDGSLVPPDQSQLLGASYGHPPWSHKYSVAPQETGQAHHTPPERWMADTGDAREDGYVQFLGASNGPRELEPPVMHRRILAGERVKGVNFVDSDHIDWTNPDEAPTGDGRVCYVSIFDDHALLVSQWGGAPYTLARQCAGLLSNQMLSKALNIDAVGTQFEQIHDGVQSFKTDLHDVLIRAHQIGWLSEDELEHYDNWRDRIGTVRSEVLSRVAQLDEMDSGLRSELFRDLQGLLASATHLYRAAGIDVTFNIRIPRVKELLDNGDALEEFLNYMRFTVPKQAGYKDAHGFHSWHRMCIEDRPAKLRARSSYEIDETNPTADLTASWLLSGPGISSLREHVEEAVRKESSRLRERVEKGVEDSATLDIPMIEANSHGHIRGLVREIADRKGFQEGNRQDLDRLTRCLEAALGTDERGPDPFLVADALFWLESRDTARDQLDTWSVQNALASLPAESIFPTLPPSARRMLSALFESDDPLDRQDLIGVTSENSYDRHHKTLRAFFLIEEVDDGFVAHLEPWWSSTTDDRTPYNEPHPSPQPQPSGGYIKQPRPPASPGALIFKVIIETEYLDIPPDRYYEISKRIDDIKWLLGELGLEGWHPILRAYCDRWPADNSQSYSGPPRVTIAGHESTEPGSQTTLPTVEAE